MRERPYTEYNGKSEALWNIAKSLADILDRKLLAIITGKCIGTGICIKIGSHYFIATAEHVAKHVVESSEETDLVSGSSSSTIIPIDPVKLSIVGHGENTELDLAYLELEKSTALKLKSDFLELDDLETEIKAMDDLVLVNGHPAEYVRPLPGERKIVMRMSFVGLPITPGGNSTGESRLEYPHSLADPDKHIVVDWPEGNEYIEAIHPTKKIVNIELPNPHGISGGGIWSTNVNIDKQKLWNTGLAKLMGINIEWNRKKCYVKGVKISHWLYLVCADYDDIELQNL